MDQTESSEHPLVPSGEELEQQEQNAQQDLDRKDFSLTISPRNIVGNPGKIIFEEIDGKETVRQHPQACSECDRVFSGAYLKKHLDANGGKCPDCGEPFVPTANNGVRKIQAALAATSVKCSHCKQVVAFNDAWKIFFAK